MWKPIDDEARRSGCVIVATQYALGKWLVNYAFYENDEWVDVHSDRVLSPHVWAPQPPDQSPAARSEAAKRFE